MFVCAEQKLSESHMFGLDCLNFLTFSELQFFPYLGRNILDRNEIKLVYTNFNTSLRFSFGQLFFQETMEEEGQDGQ